MNAKSNPESGGQQPLPGSLQPGKPAAPAAKTPAPAKQASTAKEPSNFSVTIGEFCARLSKTDKRVSMIGAFHSDEKSAGRVKDSEANYRKRYDQFVVRPVKD
jgi:hypothetical protein